MRQIDQTRVGSESVKDVRLLRGSDNLPRCQNRVAGVVASTRHLAMKSAFWGTIK